MALFPSSAPRRALPAAALALCAVFAAPAGAAIDGVLLDAQSQQPIDLPSYPFVVLYQCLNAGDTACTGFTTAGEADASGRYTLSTADIPAGRYQLVAGASDYSFHYSAPFDIAPGAALQRDIGLLPLPLSFTDVQACSTVSPQGWCRFEYTLHNRSSQPLRSQVWAHVYSRTNMPAQDSGYASGDGSLDPLRISLAAGESQRISQSVYLGVRDAGSTSSITFFAAPQGQPGSSYGFHDAGTFVDGGQALARQGRSAMLARAAAGQAPRQAARQTPAPAALQAGSAPAAAGLFVGQVVAADTGEPFDLALSPRIRLVTCGSPDDTFCSHDSGEFVYLDETGRFYLNTGAVIPERYQIEAQVRSGYGLTRSAAFDAPAAEGGWVRLALPRPKLSVSNVEGCDTVLSAEGGCSVAFDLTNSTAKPQRAWVWVQVNTYLAGSDLGFSTFVAGAPARMTPRAVTLKAGQTVRLSQTVSLAQAPKGGAEGELRLYVGAFEDPSRADASTSLGIYTVRADGSVSRRPAD